MKRSIASYDEGFHDGVRKGEGEIERLRTVLRSLISCGGTSPGIRALAMNTLETGSGDRWLDARQAAQQTRLPNEGATDK